MNGNCNFIFGISVSSMLVLNIDKISSLLPFVQNNPETTTLIMLGGIVGSIFPDIDNPDSYMGKLSVPISSVIGAISSAFGKKGRNHRGIFHDPVFYILGMYLSFLYFPPLISFFVGCFTHLYLDIFNPSGIPFIIGKRLHLGKIVSGSTESILFTWLNVLLALFIGCSIHFSFF